MSKKAFTYRQGEYLAFIHDFTERRSMAPSFEEIGKHFGTTPPSVNGMIKTLEQRGFLSRQPGVARSLRQSRRFSTRFRKAPHGPIL